MKAAIISGASVGIGSATAELFVQEGYAVYCLARRECPVSGVNSIECDLSAQDSVEDACQRLKRELADCEEIALVHNASQMLKDRVDDCANDDLARVLAINVTGINSLNQYLIPIMQSSSSVLYIGSTLSEKAVANSFSYVTSKHAQLGMMRATCQDLMGSGIHTAMICPGFTDTEMLRTHLGNDPEVEAAVAGMNSFSRLIDPAEIAELIRWAHHNPVINGAILHANLGQKES
ncbi:MAG: SDR family oxidoreductase [Halieaceae bacterium]|nr:SDR family oxidoreductase [Halieaceae bacterium]MCP4467063.1 SDR family oxidoreductase [Halieaceae bacterium]MCP4842468.1 SDR family oxidoreductase [Halieaceae bacterium]